MSRVVRSCRPSRCIHEVAEPFRRSGRSSAAPYDAIIASAGAPRLPESLRTRLRQGGRMVIPVPDEAAGQALVRLVRQIDGRDLVESLEPVRFVPLIGAEGWSGQGAFERHVHEPAKDRSGRPARR